jgi:CBS-domain-containing membrane protein
MADLVRSEEAQSLLERLVTPVRVGFLGISPIEIAATAVTMGLLIWLDQHSRHSNNPLLIPSLAASAAVIFTERGMTVARSWNVIAGQFLGAVGGLVATWALGGSVALAGGVGVALALILQQSTHSHHPPGIATAIIVVITPADHELRFLLLPVLAGIVLVVLVGWLVHWIEASLVRLPVRRDRRSSRG